MIEELPLSAIRQAEELQVRTFLLTRSEHYQALMLDGAQFPALIVFRDDGGTNWLADGFHRIAAAKKCGKETFPCEIHFGSKRDAEWYALGANSSHGLAPTKYEYQSLVQKALAHPESKNLSDNAIARHLGISQPTVSKYRASSKAFEDAPKIRKVKRGKSEYEMNTEPIGKKEPVEPLFKPEPPQVLAPQPPRDTWRSLCLEALSRTDFPPDWLERVQVLAAS